MTYALIQIEPLEVVRVYPEMPERIDWPDGAASHAVGVGFRYGSWALVDVVTVPDQPSEFHSIASAQNELTGDTLTIRRTWVISDLEKAKEALRARIDEQAEAARQAHLTPGNGQALVYHQKLMEAMAVQSDTAPNLEKYPLLGATVGIEGTSLKEVATKVVSQSKRWLEKAAEIERHRLGAKAAIADAKSVEHAIAAAQVTWP